jgi:hypothetical protein
MRRLLVVFALVALSYLGLTTNIVPVCCSDCGGLVMRTSAFAAFFGGHDWVHGLAIDGCRRLRVNGAPADSKAPAVAAGAPAAANQPEAPTERPS